MKYKIMIVEDDMGIAQGIKSAAEMWNFDAYVVNDFRHVLDEFNVCDPHLVLLDISLPFFNGYHWCQQIRTLSKVPIIFVSSTSDNMNIVMAMNMGADDFISKPFDTNVLIAKIQALLRRTYDFKDTNPTLQCHGAVLNTTDYSLTYQNEVIDLTKNEYRILLCLMQNKGKIVSREKLMEALWQTDMFVDENTLTVNVNRLRKKLDGAHLENFIITKPRVGYMVE